MNGAKYCRVEEARKEEGSGEKYIDTETTPTIMVACEESAS